MMEIPEMRDLMRVRARQLEKAVDMMEIPEMRELMRVRAWWL
jgi:hypothetical protein